MSRTRRMALILLLAAGGAVGAPGGLVSQDPPPLLAAATSGDTDRVRQLLDGGADPNQTGVGGQTALMLAAGAGHSEVVDLLLEHGASPTAWDVDEDTALGAYAAANGHTEIVRMLIEAGSSPLAANRDGMNPLMFAALYGHLETILLLEAEMLPLAAEQSLSELADRLTAAGRDVDAARVRSRVSTLSEELQRRDDVSSGSGARPALLMLTDSDSRCIDLGYPSLVQCVLVEGCTYTRSGRIDVTWLGVATDNKEIVERFVRDARRLEADGVIDTEIELGMYLGRARIARIVANAISFSDDRCKKLARDG